MWKRISYNSCIIYSIQSLVVQYHMHVTNDFFTIASETTKPFTVKLRIVRPSLVGDAFLASTGWNMVEHIPCIPIFQWFCMLVMSSDQCHTVLFQTFILINMTCGALWNLKWTNGKHVNLTSSGLFQVQTNLLWCGRELSLGSVWPKMSRLRGVKVDKIT